MKGVRSKRNIINFLKIENLSKTIIVSFRSDIHAYAFAFNFKSLLNMEWIVNNIEFFQK